MSSETQEAAPWKILEELIERGDPEQLQLETELLGIRESARAISRLSTEEQSKALSILDAEYAAELMHDLPEAQAVELFSHLEPEAAAPILSEMESDVTVDVLSQLEEGQAQQILAAMEPGAAAEARRLSQYESDVAGGLMLTEYLAYPATYTVREVVEDMRRNAEEYGGYSIQYAYVVDTAGRLAGVLSLRDLLLKPDARGVSEVMIPNPVSVRDTTPLDALAEVFDESSFLGYPVTNDEGRLLGIIRRDDVSEAMGDRAQDVYLKTQGIVGGEELRSMPTLRRSRRRLSWLSVNVVLNIISASVIALYQDTLASVIALAVFIPIISDMSGCSGNQAVAVSMRELTLGLVKPRDVVYVWMKEFSVAIINGLVLGMLVAAVAWIWKGNAWLGLVVGTAMALNTVVAAVLGGSIPLILKRFDQDPALASGPILTTVTDMCGFFFVLSFATALLPYLT